MQVGFIVFTAQGSQVRQIYQDLAENRDVVRAKYWQHRIELLPVSA